MFRELEQKDWDVVSAGAYSASLWCSKTEARALPARQGRVSAVAKWSQRGEMNVKREIHGARQKVKKSKSRVHSNLAEDATTSKTDVEVGGN